MLGAPMTETAIRAEPVLPSRDLAATAAFYGALGFTERHSSPDYLIVARDGAVLHFWPCTDPAVLAACGCYLRLADPSGFHAAAVATGARTLPPEAKPWGMEEGALWDPNGNLLRFGRPIQE